MTTWREDRERDLHDSERDSERERERTNCINEWWFGNQLKIIFWLWKGKLLEYGIEKYTCI